MKVEGIIISNDPSEYWRDKTQKYICFYSSDIPNKEGVLEYLGKYENLTPMEVNLDKFPYWNGRVLIVPKPSDDIVTFKHYPYSSGFKKGDIVL